MFIFRSFVLAAMTLAADVAVAKPTSYGSLKYDPEMPGVLFLIDEIKAGDSFELRRAMRDQEIDLVVAASPGGNLYEGLQIAAILHDNGIGTYIPQGESCESSCANIFLGGAKRLLRGELGVHQFFSSAKDSSASRSLTTSATQYTTSDIIGIMNQFDTPPFVYEKMFGTSDIYYFTPAQKTQLNRRTDEEAFRERVLQVDAFLSGSAAAPPVAAARPAPSRAPEPPLKAAALEEKPPLKAEPIEAKAAVFLNRLNADWSSPNEQALARLGAYYAAQVDFYGKPFSLAEILADKTAFAKRWPIRNYRIDPATLSVYCRGELCDVTSVVLWSASSPQRGKEASGSLTWSLILKASGDELKIISEKGETLQRK